MMIHKIQEYEYLKRLDNMSLDERREYLNRVGEWLQRQAPLLTPKQNNNASRFQTVTQCCASWNDEECRAWTDGAQLLSALVMQEDTWLPDMLYEKAVRRAIHRMTAILSVVMVRENARKRDEGNVVKASPKEARSESKEQTAGKGHADDARRPAKNKTEVQVNKTAMQPLPSGQGATPIRPKHIDQYVHLLPKATQEKAATVRALLRDLDVARENARKLMDADEQGDKIAQWAKTATKLDNKVRAIYRELDAEWDKLVKTGVVSTDAFGNAVIKPQEAESPENPDNLETPENLDNPENPENPESPENPDDPKAVSPEEKKKKINSLRSWLRDTRRGNDDKREAYVKQWKEKFCELLQLGGTDAVTNAVCAAAEHYGIKLDEVMTRDDGITK